MSLANPAAKTTLTRNDKDPHSHVVHKDRRDFLDFPSLVEREMETRKTTKHKRRIKKSCLLIMSLSLILITVLSIVIPLSKTSNQIISPRQKTRLALLFAIGSPGIAGFVDGPATDAKFNGPMGMAADIAGNIYVADSGNNAIRKINSTNHVSTISGNGTIGWLDGTNALYNMPSDVSLDSTFSLLYIADTGNHRIRCMDLSKASVKTIAGQSKGQLDGQGSNAAFSTPMGIAVDAGGLVYVGDTGSGILRVINASNYVSTLDIGRAGSGVRRRSSETVLNRPLGVALYPPFIFVVESGTRAIFKMNGRDWSSSRISLSGNFSYCAVDGAGSLWIPAEQEIIRVLPNGNVVMYEALASGGVVVGLNGLVVGIGQAIGIFKLEEEETITFPTQTSSFFGTLRSMSSTTTIVAATSSMPSPSITAS